MNTLGHAITAACAKAIAEIKRGIAHIRRVRAELEESRARIEKELHRGRYTLSSKNDDDLPLVR